MTYATPGMEAAEARTKRTLKPRPQIELLRELDIVLAHDEEAIARAYARAEEAGLVVRPRNSHDWSAETYGRAYYRGARRKGQLWPHD